ncbi:NACHT domain-containing protein [Fusarium austroafricanum]|uniref:NACHT domain-containing protein n=1 Tax=Fusarium austroafricanum TaxID=2364996 RepID=A0A8H4JTL2_9HYPO|nr:NACHT domain-containing protein [Fusarium austroafricanum]
MPLKPPVSALARQTIKNAFDELDRTINLGDKREFQNTTLQDVQKAALDIENQLAARQSLRNMRRLMPLFQGLEHYSKVLDILCNGTPYLPWIWAPITLILRIASEYVEAFEHIIKGYASIAESLKRFEILRDAFINNSEFQKTLAVFYADILKFHQHAYKFVRRSGWKLMFSTSWGRVERRFANILEDMKQHGSLIDLEASARDIAEAKAMRDDIRKWREESEKNVHHQEIEETTKQFESIVSWLKVNEPDQLAIFDSISLETAELEGTCAWILQNPKIRSWVNNKPDTPTLWLQGSAGTGKSVLCTQLVNFLKGSKFVIYHFCTYLYASSTMYEQILRSFILQLLRKDNDLVAHVYKSCVMERKSPSVAMLEQLIQTILASLSSDPNQEEKAKTFGKPSQLDHIKTSGTRKHYLQAFNIKSCIAKLAAASQREANYLFRIEMKLRQLDVGSREVGEIQNVVVEKADGMFLYARLVMDYLANNIFYSGDEIKESVNQLPQGITDFYQNIITQILVHLDPRSVDRIKCVLSWLAFAKRPLRKFELLSAVTFSSGDPQVCRLAPQYILEICGTLIEERRDATLTFIHSSVKEFLQTASKTIAIKEHQALQEHGVAAVTCLLSGLKVFSQGFSEPERVLRVAKGVHAFHVYATEFWTEYLLSTNLEATVFTDSTSRLINLALRLADQLEISQPMGSSGQSDSKLADKRLELFQQYPVLQRHMNRALKDRSLETLESRIFQEHGRNSHTLSQNFEYSTYMTSQTKTGRTITDLCASQTE